MRKSYRGESNALLVVAVGVALLVGAVFTYISFVGMQYTTMPAQVSYAPRVVEAAQGAAPKGQTASFLANRLTSAVPEGLKQTDPAFWGATRIQPFSDTKICASEVKKGAAVLEFSWIDSPALQEGVAGCEKYATVPGDTELIEGLGVKYVLDGKEVDFRRHPTTGATSWKTYIDPNNDEVVATCEYFITALGGSYSSDDQCLGATWGADIAPLLTPGRHAATLTITAPDAPFQCSWTEDSVINTSITVDPRC